MDIITEILSREEKIKSTVDPAEVALLLGLTGQEFKKIREAVINDFRRKQRGKLPKNQSELFMNKNKLV